jgi:hypothetical protein
LNGSILHTIVNVPGSYGLGTSVSGAGDVDGDGYADFVVSTESFGQTNSARAVAYSGRTGAILIDERGDPRLAGASVAGSGDLTGNGRSGIVIGSHYDSNEDHGRVRVIVTLDTHPGTQEDFVLASGVGGTLTTYNIKQARAGEVFSARMTSPGGTFAPFPPVLIGQLTSSPATYPNVPGLPELQLDPTRPYVILVDGTQGPFGSLQLPAAGITTGGYVVPSGLEGMSFMLQAFSLSPLAANGIVAMSDGNEIQFVP